MIRPSKLRSATTPTIAALFALLLLVLGIFVTARLDADYRDQQRNVAQSRAEVLSKIVTAAVDFGDRQAAGETITALRVAREVRMAGVYDSRGRLFVGFSRPGEELPQILPAHPPVDRYAIGRAAITLRGKHIGTVAIRSELEPALRRAGRYALVGLLVVVASLIIAVLARVQQQLRRANTDLAATNSELVRQIAEREKAEADLRQVQRMESIGQLTGGIAHDFNNMLAIVIGSLEMAARRFDTHPDRARAAIGHALEGAGRAAKLTQRLLAFARRQPLQPQPVDSNQLVQGMSELLRRTLGEGVIIETVLGGGLWRTLADPSELENAILNLCVNARDAMQNTGRLTIETANAHLDDAYAAQNDVKAGQYVAVIVTDNGPGMPPDVVARAFEPFFTTKGVGKGTGLGLSQVYGFCRQSGGHVKIYSELNVGTTVRIYLPRYLGAGATERQTSGQNQLLGARAGELVLVVEDEDQVRRVSADALHELGYSVLEAPNPEAALAILAERTDVQLLFTDIVMPGMNGRELADRARRFRPDLRVVYTTGYSRNAIIHNGVVDADVNFLQKPFTLAQLARKIRDALDSNA